VKLALLFLSSDALLNDLLENLIAMRSWCGKSEIMFRLFVRVIKFALSQFIMIVFIIV